MRNRAETIAGLNELYRHTDGEEHAKVVEAMRVFGYPEFAETLLDAIYDESPNRGAAVIAFAFLVEQEHIDHVLRLLKDPDPYIVHIALSSLYNVTGDKVTLELHRLLGHPSSEIREEAARYLGKQCPSAYDAIHQAYISGMIGEEATLNALTLTRDPRAIELITGHMSPDDPLFKKAYMNLLLMDSPQAEAILDERWERFRQLPGS